MQRSTASVGQAPCGGPDGDVREFPGADDLPPPVGVGVEAVAKSGVRETPHVALHDRPVQRPFGVGPRRPRLGRPGLDVDPDHRGPPPHLGQVGDRVLRLRIADVAQPRREGGGTPRTPSAVFGQLGRGGIRGHPIGVSRLGPRRHPLHLTDQAGVQRETQTLGQSDDDELGAVRRHRETVTAGGRALRPRDIVAEEIRRLRGGARERREKDEDAHQEARHDRSSWRPLLRCQSFGLTSIVRPCAGNCHGRTPRSDEPMHRTG